MRIAVLGIDLGKNVCSVVGLNDGGTVVLRRRTKAGHSDCADRQDAAVRCCDGGLLWGPSSRPAVRPPTVMTCA